MKLVFMGTPDFAAAALEAIAACHEVLAVFTQPDKPVGRKQVLGQSPVKQLALRLGIPVFQPVSLKTAPEPAQILRDLAPDCIVVAAYGKILPVEILSIPPLGCINIHASLLPNYRGASPIQAALLNGDAVTGVTTMYMDVGIDTGDMLETAEVPILPEDMLEPLTERLAVAGGQLILSTLEKLANGTAIPCKQPEGATYAPIVTKDMARLDFSLSAARLHNMVRAFQPWPVAWFALDGKKIKVFSAAVSADSAGCPPGTVIEASGALTVACGAGALRILSLQPENGKVMSAADYLRGHPIPEDKKLFLI